jgi:hypothetical protein
MQKELERLPDDSPVFSVPSVVGAVELPVDDAYAIIVSLEVAETLQQRERLGFQLRTDLAGDARVRVLVADTLLLLDDDGETTSMVCRLLDYGRVPL